MKNLEEELRIIYKIVWSYVKSNPGLEFEDLVSEAYLIYLETISQYDETKGSKSNYIHNIVRNHINTLIGSKQEVLATAELLESLYSNEGDPEQTLVQKEKWEEIFDSLSSDAKVICNMLLYDSNLYLPTDKPRKCRGIIMRELRKNNWSWNKIWNAIKELKLASI